MGGGYVLPRGSAVSNGDVELGFKEENGFTTRRRMTHSIMSRRVDIVKCGAIHGV